MSNWFYLALGALLGGAAATATIHAAVAAKKQLEEEQRMRPVLPDGWTVYENENFRPS